MAATTFRLRVWTRFFAPPEAVWQIKTDPRRLAAELTPFVYLHLSEQDARILAAAVQQPGGTAEVAARMVPPGVAWPIRLRDSQPGRSYVDHSENLLFARFEHQHLLEEAVDGCRYIDDVVFRPRLPGAKLTAVLTRRLFVHRHQVAAQALPADRRTVGTSVLRVLIEEEGGG